MTKTMIRKKEQAPEAEVQEEPILSNPYLETNIPMKDEAQEEVVVSNPFVETLWKQYEQTLEQARKLRESSEETYLKSVKDVIKFNKDFRKSTFALYTESRKSNSEIVKGVSSNFVRNDVNNPLSEQHTQQVEDISERLEKLAITPIKFTVDLIETLEKNVEENSEAYVRYSRESQSAWGKVTDEYVKIAKNNHKMLVNQLEDSINVLVGTIRK